MFYKKIEDRIKLKEAKKDRKNKFMPLQIALIYALAGCIWILFFDKLILTLVDKHSVFTSYQSFKSWLFVLSTTVLIYFLLKYIVKISNNYSENVMNAYKEMETAHLELTAAQEQLGRQYEELLKSREALQLSEERYRLVIEGSNDAIWYWDVARKEPYFFGRTKELLGYRQDELDDSYESWRNLIHPDDLKIAQEAMRKHIDGLTPIYRAEYRMRTKDHQYKWILSRGKVTTDENGKHIRMAGSHTDITESKRVEERIHHLAYYDSLTSLPNRTLFSDRVTLAIAQAKRNEQKLAIFYLDLDNFKSVNDTSGHSFGDLLLKNLSGLLKDCLRETDTVTRLSGDEFAILLPVIESIEDVQVVASRIIDVFSKPFTVHHQKFNVTASIGVAIFPEAGHDIQDLLKCADMAMYTAKEQGKNRYCLYSPEMNKKIQDKMQLESDLRKALENKEFVIFYQPQVDVVSGKVIGLEALVRWRHPIRGMIQPLDFIPAAEETGLIIPLGEWVLRSACKQNKMWQQAGFPKVCVSVNISACQLQQDHFVEMITDALTESDLESQWLELEITENLAIKDIDRTIPILKSLRSIGVKISLDDFGTGYSLLNYLKQLPVDILKIDKSFIRDITQEGQEDAITKALIELAHSMNLIVTAEGVETSNQLKYLKKQFCDKAQGYLFSKPVPVDEIERLLRQDRILH